MNAVIFIIGILLVVAGILTDYEVAGDWDNTLLNLFFFLQFFPMMVSEMSIFKYSKKMRQTNSDTIHKAQLRPHRLFDFVLPMLFGTGVFVNIAFILFAFSAYPNQFYLGSKATNMIAVLTCGNLFFAAIILWNIYGKKLDPYQSNKDRNRQIRLTEKLLILISIAATVFLMMSIILDVYYLDHLMPTSLSLYYVLLAIISFQALTPVLQIDDTDFEVYKVQ
ncbi:MAG: hypothetical protein R3C41_22395 [Calditrichia bacterium]